MQLATDDDKARAGSTLPQGVQRTLSQAVGSHGLLRAADFAVALVRAREQLAQQQGVRFLVGQQSDVGHVRTLNEDSLWVMAPPSAPSVGVFVVADGVGGHAAGDVASRLAVEAIARHGDDLQRARADGDTLDAEAWLTRAAKAANQAVYRERLAASNDMGCTLVMALVVGRAATVLNVGDSRAYRLGPRGIDQITTDHSLVQRLVDIGQLSPEEARHHPQKSVIYRVIGDSPDLAMDLFHVRLASGEALLLCSDGLSDMVVDDVIRQVWQDAASPQAACDRLVALAKEAGGYDNITVVLAQIA
jgi:protein phosphatase